VSRYDAGAAAERKAKAELEERGYLVVRSAGSKGPADLIAVKVRYIQVKKVEKPQAWTGELEKLRQGLPAAPGMSRELWVWNAGCGFEKYVLEEQE